MASPEVERAYALPVGHASHVVQHEQAAVASVPMAAPIATTMATAKKVTFGSLQIASDSGATRRGYGQGGVNDRKSTQDHHFKRSSSSSFSRPMRKRSYSFTEGHSKSVNVPSNKRWKGGGKQQRRGLLPSKFLLGGNIHDPLNLNSLSDERINRIVNAVTPESSPLPTPKHRKAEYKIEVLIPPNISDPLNLNATVDENEYEAKLISPNVVFPGKAKAKKQKEVIQNSKTTKNNFRTAKNSQQRRRTKPSKSDKEPSSDQKPAQVFKDKNKKYEFGNYSRYYGYRNPMATTDVRLQHTPPEWFRGRDVLDIGCNAGQVTIAIAKEFAPKSIVGMDIDKSLVQMARKNLLHAKSCHQPDGETQFPQNLPAVFGPIRKVAAAGEGESDQRINNTFPNNIRFICGNYVLDSDELLEATQPEFDTILCLSTTKWLHLNFGDEGLKRAFKRMHAQLRPGGLLILEAQGFSSYRKRKKLTKRIFENFQSIKLLPEHFSDYLLHEVGFSTGHTAAIPSHSAKGFQRPIQVFLKRSFESSRSVSSRQTTPHLFPSPLPSGPEQKRLCYAPSLTPLYGITTPSYSPVYYGTPSRLPSPTSQPVLPSPSSTVAETTSSVAGPAPSASRSAPAPDLFPRPLEPSAPAPGPSGELYSPSYSPSETPTYSGYSGYTPGRSGITPGYSGPSPDYLDNDDAASRTPVYSGPPSGLVSTSSTPGHLPEAGEGAGFTPNYTPSIPGTPVYSPGQFSPGNATPKTETPPHCASSSSASATRTSSASSLPPSQMASSSSSQGTALQMPEVSGNTTPHPGASGGSPAEAGSSPKYSWYGYGGGGTGSSSGGTTPRSVHEASTSPHAQGHNDSNPNTPASPATPASPGGSEQQ